jgi:hypothetical protein
MRISPQLKSVDVSRAEFPQSRLSAGCFSGRDSDLIFAPWGYDDPEIFPS